ncbi:autophagy-related protein 16-1-like isoform X2 [Symsagittifera roscoffensis]|uniref:autophagy-related protein 16-1-like isoform X2 n=1 Tax=Symsagittifera roscoffensis TaxID=84072 RepID=UPI00307BD253
MSNSTSETSSPTSETATPASETQTTYSSELSSPPNTDNVDTKLENISSGEEAGVSRSYEQQRTPVFSPHAFRIATGDRVSLLQGLRKRNLRESTPFVNLFQEHELIYNRVEQLQKKTIQLQIDNERLKQTKDASFNSQGEHSDSHLRNELSELEKRLYETQRDLTTALRGKDENSQKILDLNDKIRQKDDALAQRDQKMRNLEAELESAKKTISQMSSKIEILEEQKQVQADEYSLLALSCSQFEERLLKSEEENRLILQQCVKFKQQFADQLNDKNAEFIAGQAAARDKKVSDNVREMGEKLKQLDTDKEAIFTTKYDVTNLILATDIPENPRNTLEAHTDEVTCVRFLNNNSFISAGVDRFVKIWDCTSATQIKPIATLSSCNGAVTCIDVDQQESCVVASSYDNSSRIWSLKDHRLKHSLTGHTGKVMAARFISDDSHKVATGSYDRTIKVWDLKQRLCSMVLHCHSSCTDLVAMEANLLCSGHLDKRVRCWDIRRSQTDFATNEVLLSGKVTSVHTGRERRDILACTKDGQLHVIDHRMMKVTATLVSDSLKIGADYCRATLSPDGRFAMAGSSDGTLVIFDVNSQNVSKILKAQHHSVILCTAWSNDGTKLLSADKGKKVILWCDRTY